MAEKSTKAAGGMFDQLEETLIAVLLGLMTMITFANVIARYVFNDNILWALETTVFLFAWMVLLGVSYGVKHSFHIGVDVLVQAVSPATRRTLTLLALAACLAFSVLMLKGALDYWLPFAGKRAFLETDDVPMPEFMQFLADWINYGERYEKMPRVIPYFILPLSMSLLLFRFIQAGLRIWKGDQELLIAGHEAEELLEEVNQSENNMPSEDASHQGEK